jgi:hypothetical protein
MRWLLLAVLAIVAIAAVVKLRARLPRRSESRASILLSVIAHWLGAYVLWTFAAGLAHRYGLIAAYDSAAFVVLALVVGYWHYRTRLARGREPALAVFVGGQLVWLVIQLARNGVFRQP